MMRQPGEAVGRAVHARAVVVAIGAVHRGRQRPRRRVDFGVLEFRRRRAGNEIEQALVVAELRQRQFLDFLGRECGAGVGLVRLEQLDFRLHGDRLGQRADFQPGLDAADRAGGHRDVLLHELLEPLQADFDVVRARQHVGEGVGAALVRDGGHGEVVVTVDDGDRGARDAGPRSVLHGSYDAAVELLRCCARCGGDRHGQPRERNDMRSDLPQSHESSSRNDSTEVVRCFNDRAEHNVLGAVSSVENCG